MSTPIRLGIIGAGAIVKTRHLPGLAAIEDCQVVAVHNRRRANAEAVAAEWNIPHVADSAEEIIARDDINVVLIGTTPYLHRDLSVAALEAGKHVFCQARMARNLAEARDMLAAAKKHPQLVTMICPAPHAFPLGKAVAQAMEKGELGALRLVRLHHLNSNALSAEAPHHWRFDREISGHNIMTLGIYVEILQRWLGAAKTVSAVGKVFTTERRDGETGKMMPVAIPESLVVSGELGNGAQYVYTFSSVAPFARGDMVEIYGTAGGLLYELNTDTVRIGVRPRGFTTENQRISQGLLGTDEVLREVPVAPPMQGGWTVEADFVAAIREGAPVFPNFEHGVAYMEFLEAVGLSLEQGRTIELPLA